MNKVYFPGLNGLRAIAAWGVVLHHLEQVKNIFGLPNLWNVSPMIQHLGASCVHFFFVLSGFIITYLLLCERQLTGQVNIKKFYMRRALRIWPLYYTIMILGLLILPSISAYSIPTYSTTFDGDFEGKVLLFFFFSPHLAVILFKGILPYAGILWSLGVEEWFYALWPWMTKLKSAAVAGVAIAVIVAMFIARSWLKQGWLGGIFLYLRFDFMATGALAAVLLFRCQQQEAWAKRVVQLLFRREAQVLAVLSIVWAIRLDLGLIELRSFVLSVGSALCILNVGANPKALVKLENRAWHWLGEISFGTYCYNWIALVSAVILVRWLDGLFIEVPKATLVSILGPVLTLIMAAISYYRLELPFLRMKRRFEVSTLKVQPAQSQSPTPQCGNAVSF